MKTLLILLMLLLPTTALALDLSEHDKQAHMTAGAMFGSLTGLGAIMHDGMTWKSGLIAFGVANLPGIAKEIDDDVFDFEDIQADMIGVGLSIICLKLGWEGWQLWTNDNVVGISGSF